MNKINILIPMAGEGSRFKKGGYKNIKPLIPLNGKTFIEWSIESVTFNNKNIESQFIFVIRTEHKDKLVPHLKSIIPNCIILYVEKLSRGAVETCLEAKKYINNDTPLIITNSDQIIEWDKQKYLDFLIKTDPDSNVVTTYADTDKFSYIKTDENGLATKLAEKEVISNDALIGVHYWKKGKFFVDSGEELILRNIRANNEFYVSLTYNILINNNVGVTQYKLDKNNEKYLSIGTPEQVIDYLKEKELAVKIYKMEDMFRGWFVGNFEPSVHKTSDFEAGYLKHNKGEKWPVHFHEKAREINYLVKGKIKINNKIINKGDIFIFEQYGVADPEFLEDCELVCIKTPSLPTDKIIM